MAAGAIHALAAFRFAHESGADFICAGMFDFQIVEDRGSTRAARGYPGAAALQVLRELFKGGIEVVRHPETSFALAADVPQPVFRAFEGKEGRDHDGGLGLTLGKISRNVEIEADAVVCSYEDPSDEGIRAMFTHRRRCYHIPIGRANTKGSAREPCIGP